MKSAETKTSENPSKAAANQFFCGNGISLFAPGNRFFMQPKLTVNQPDDIYEQEADRVANDVMTMQSPVIQTKPLQISSIQRICSHCEAEQKNMQRKRSGDGGVTADNELEGYVGNLNSGGEALAEDVLSFFEPRFGYELSNVKVHTGLVAAKSAQSINALAYTSGNHIVFNSGQYSPDTDTGKQLLAHELTHVVQQANTNIKRKKLSEEEKQEDLQSDRLKNDLRLQAAFDQSPSMQSGEISEGVKTVQRALKDLGYNLQVSFLKTGDADGIFGTETKAAVKQFQRDNTLSDDGVLGRDTLGALDKKFIVVPPAQQCNINYSGGLLDAQSRDDVLNKHFTDAERPSAATILDDLCAVKNDHLNFSGEDELVSEVRKRMLAGKYMQESQTDSAFAYPEHAKPNNCPGAIGNALKDARVNTAAKDYWNGPIIETRSVIKNQHYYFELTDKGKDDAYTALKLLFTKQDSICDRTLIHCDTLITLVNILVYAETIGITAFNAKVKSGQLGVWLTYDGLSAVENDTTPTAVTSSLTRIVPSDENDLVIGDHVVFWNHQAYDAISLTNPGPWRLENALLVTKDASGEDMFEGHGAPVVSGSIKPGSKREIHTELMNNYNPYAVRAADLATKNDAGDTDAAARLATEFPRVFKNTTDNKWYIKETDSNSSRPRKEYELKVITDPFDPEIIGLRNPYNPSQMGSVERPQESL
jgi:hypothetical protein